MLQAYPPVFPAVKETSLYVSSCPPPYQLSKTSLNPNAQEWVPKEYRTPCNNTATLKQAPIPAPKVSGYQPFCEITEKELRDSQTFAPPSDTHAVNQCQVAVPPCLPRGAERRGDEEKGVDTSPQHLESSVAVVSQSLSPPEANEAYSPAASELKSPSSSPAVTRESEITSPVVSSSSESVSTRPEQVSESIESPQDGRLSPAPVCVDASASRSPCLSSPEPSVSSVETNQVQESVGRPHADSLTEGLTNQSCTTPDKTSTSTSQASTLSQDSPHTIPLKIQDCVCVEVPQGRATGDGASLSYAGVVGRVSPSPPPPVDTAKLKYKGIEQPIPKIFQGDGSPSRQGDGPRVPSDSRMPELFKRPSKSQRTRSRRFLQELKELSQNHDICGSPSSVSDASVTSDDLSTPPMSPQKSFTLASSPQSRMPPLALSPQSGSHVLSSSPQPGTPTMSSPLTIPVPIPAPSTGSPGSRTRTSSESSVASLDIEFVEQDEVDHAIPDRAALTKRSPGAGGRNGFLACILGSGESDSETDEDSDWDECEVDSAPTLDDSWETFGFGLVVVECRMAPLESQAQCQKPQVPQESQEVPETHTEERSSDPVLCEINRKWEEEVQKDVQGKTDQRVTFGKETVHPMVVWGHAYRQARRAPWEQQARDRARFAQRVASLEAELSLVLDPGHRRRVYRRLYSPPSRCFL